MLPEVAQQPNGGKTAPARRRGESLQLSLTLPVDWVALPLDAAARRRELRSRLRSVVRGHPRLRAAALRAGNLLDTLTETLARSGAVLCAIHPCGEGVVSCCVFVVPGGRVVGDDETLAACRELAGAVAGEGPAEVVRLPSGWGLRAGDISGEGTVRYFLPLRGSDRWILVIFTALTTETADTRPQTSALPTPLTESTQEFDHIVAGLTAEYAEDLDEARTTEEAPTAGR